jgi:hypothetical protein
MMRSRPLSKSTWPAPKRLWHPLYRSGALRGASSAAIGADFRLWLMAVDRAGHGGHAPFEPEEIRQTLTKVHRGTGEISQYSTRAINKLIASLVEAGLLVKGSNSRCLQLPVDVLDPREKSRVNCPEHRHRLAWGELVGWVKIDTRTEGFVAAA